MDCSVKKLLTVDDLVRSGACCDGVMEWHQEHCPDATVLPTKAVLRLCVCETQESYVEEAAGMRGYGDGYGYGNGYGSGQ